MIIFVGHICLVGFRSVGRITDSRCCTSFTVERVDGFTGRFPAACRFLPGIMIGLGDEVLVIEYVFFFCTLFVVFIVMDGAVRRSGKERQKIECTTQ